MKVRKKPVVVEAFRFAVDEPPQWFKEAESLDQVVCFSQYGGEKRWCEIQTLEGTMTAQVGDWIIRGVKGEFYPCRDDIFQQTYAPVEEALT